MVNLEMFIERLYRGFDHESEVMALIGVIPVGDNIVIEKVKYFTSLGRDSVVASFKEIVQDMVNYGLVARGKAEFILVHNHPQGTARASDSDRKMKERLAMVAEFLGVRFLGSYIYVEGHPEIINVSGVTEIDSPRDKSQLHPNKNVIQNNLYLADGNYRYPEMDILVEYREYEEDRVEKEWYKKQLNNSVLDKEFIEGSKLGLVLLDEDNKILNLIDAEKLVDDEDDFEGTAQMCMPKEKVSFFLGEGHRYLLYDTRTDLDLENLGVRRSEEGIAQDTLLLTKMMGIMMYPIEYYMR